MALLVGAGWGQSARVETEKMAATVMREWPAGVVSTIKKPGEWSYEEGTLLDGMAAEWEVSHNPAELAYVKAAVDKYVKPDGTIVMGPSGRAFPVEAHTLDDIEMGRAVLFCYRQTHEQKYATAAKFLHEALKSQPRNASGGYWHKQIYPNQMWLDGAYMAEPFRAEYAVTFDVDELEDVASQFLLMDFHMRDAKTGLLLHGWDESQKMPWAAAGSGLSPEVWARAMGWYCMALVDVLDWMPEDFFRRWELLRVLGDALSAVDHYQSANGLWWQVMDQGSSRSHPGRAGKLTAREPAPASKEFVPAPGNFVEASASAMFTYALAKAVRKGYVPAKFGVDAQRGWAGIQQEFVTTGPDGVVLTGTVKAAGLGGMPYRSGTYEYYVGEARGDQDAKGVGAYLLAGSEMGR